jgi:phospholipid/cholesterol/gamma-HCH transport system substrate-binding protein
MNERLMQFRVGVMVLFTLVLAAILVSLFGGLSPLGPRPYTIYVRFPETPGVTRGTPIRKSGIRIGQVADIRFTDRDTAVLVVAKIDGDRHVYHNEVCRVVSSILMGDAALEFTRSPDPNLPDTAVEPGETLQGLVAQDPTRAIANLQQNLGNTIGSVDVASKDMHAVLSRLDHLLEVNEERITKVIGQSDQTLQLLQKTLTSANGVLGDPVVREQFKQSMAELPGVLSDTRNAIDHLDRGLSSLLVNLKNVEGVTEPLGKRGETVIQRIDQSTEKLDRLMDEMLRFSQDLNNPQGSIGQLVHDRELYQHLNHAARNIEEVTRELRPILDDVRSFSDKISRHPEVLGVRGAIQRNSGMK